MALAAWHWEAHHPRKAAIWREFQRYIMDTPIPYKVVGRG